MSAIPQGFASRRTALYPEFGNGVYIGNNPGGGTTLPPGGNGGYGGCEAVAVNSGIIIQTDKPTGFLSTISSQPQNVFRITTAFGNSFIQSGGNGTALVFGVPFSGQSPNSMLFYASTGVLNVPIEQVSSLASKVNPTQTINIDKLVSSAKGYGWA